MLGSIFFGDHPYLSPEPRSGFWKRLFSSAGEPIVVPAPVAAPRVAPAPAVDTVTQRREMSEPILVPAEGDAFDFQIFATYTWIGREMSVEDLRQRIDQYGGWAVRVVREHSAEVARTYPPHQAKGLQSALNEKFAGQSWSWRGDGIVLRFTAQVRVIPDERVRERLRPYWESRIKLECEHELEKLRAQQAAELTRRWRDVLASLTDDPVTAHAARLTSKQFAEVFDRYVTEQRQAVPELVDLLEKALKGHGDLGMGPSEYTEAWDVALRTYQRQHGLVAGS